MVVFSFSGLDRDGNGFSAAQTKRGKATPQAALTEGMD